LHFTRLRLTGFKSFVDPTELLVEPGLTGVVGPNGCGKSNLLEAIRWVMGENSPKSMRGSGMEDVIFAGTSGRSARNLAEVTLHLDNTSRKAPPAFNDELYLEVVRRIERDSGSAYRINGRDVRAKDVQLLFADMATGAHSPALVSQGRIGALINAKPRDRRAILEEAAGISGLHSRRNEAERRLKAAETNLTRVSDVTQQIESQISNLKRQARQAERYRKVGTLIRQNEAVLHYLLWIAAAEKLQETETALRQWESAVADITAESSKLSTRQVELAADLPALRKAEAERAAALHHLAVSHDALTKEEQQILDAQERLAAQLEQATRDKEREDGLIQDTRDAIARLKEERTELLSNDKGQAEERRTSAEAVDRAVKAAGEREADLDELRRRTASAEAERNRLAQQVRAAEGRFVRLTSDLGAARSRLEALSTTSKATQEADQLTADLARLEEETRAAQDQIETARTEIDKRRETEKEARDAVQALETRLARFESERDAITTLLIPAQGDIKPVADGISVTPGYEAALGAALGDDLDVPLDDSAAVHWSALPDYGTPHPLPDGVKSLADFVKAPAVLARRLGQIGVVEDAPTRALLEALTPGQRLVTKDGALWRWDGFTAAADAPTAAAQRLAQKNRLKEIDADIAEIEQTLAQASALKDKASTRVAEMVETERTAQAALKAADQRKGDVRRALAEIERRAAQEAAQRTALEETIERLVRECGDADTEKTAAEEALAELPPVDNLRIEADAVKAEVDKLRLKLAEARAAHDTLAAQARHRKQRLEGVERELDAWQVRLDSASRQIDALAERETQARQELEKLEDRPRQIRAERARLTDEIEIAETARKEAAEKLAEAEALAGEADRELKEVQTRLGEAREQKVRIETSLEQMVEKRREISRTIMDSFGVPPQKVLEAAEVDTASDELPDMDEVENRLDNLKRERDRLGAVNLRADIELEEFEGQLAQLTSEKADLETAIGRLRQAISELNREGRERLLAAFEEVNNHFGTLFQTLFGGGHAYLTLTESDDPLDAGLEIMASPPGKKLQVLSLLSGGEQALTALSLIFAVFITNPAPICVLDEVDAPLDDANVERFCDLLDEMVRRTNTRFLIVTHNAVTMSRMNRLFGVTMVERGVSKLVSVDLEQAEQMRAVG
jgi:chromosome segregation protein